MGKKTESIDYQKERENNERIFSEMVQRLRPDVWVLMDLLDKTGINYYILYIVIKQLYNLATGTKFGQVVISVTDNVVYTVKGEEVNKIDAPILKKSKNQFPIDKGGEMV